MKNKKLFAILTLVCFMFTFMPVAAMADDSTTHSVATKDELTAAIANAADGDIIKLTDDIDYGNAQLKIDKAITLDLGGYKLTNSFGYGGLSLNGNCSVVNGTIDHKGGVAAIKAWNVDKLENLTITVAERPNKTVGGIVVQEGSEVRINTIKNVTINGSGLTNGIETYNCGNATEPVIGSMENVTIDAVGTAMNISAPCGTATNCTFNGGVSGIEIWIKGTYSAILDLKGCTVEGGTQAVYAHDEFNSNPNIENNGTLKLTMDDATALKGTTGLTTSIARAENIIIGYDFEEAVAKIGDTYYNSLQVALNEAVAGSGEVTVEILKDIDLTNIDWNPVTVSAPGYPCVTVNGNNHTITNLNDMLFAATWAGNSGLIINDLTIKNSNIVNDKNDSNGNVGVGAFIGYPQASGTVTLNNCHLVDSTVKGGHWTGGLIGIAGGYNDNDGPVFMNLTVKDCSVTGSNIEGKGSAGAVIGHAACAAWTKVVIEDTTITGNTITSTGSSTNKAGVVMGTIGVAGQPATANGETKTGGVYVVVTENDNKATSNGTEITTVYGRQGSEGGMLTLNPGGEYANYPIEEDVEYAKPAEGYEVIKNADGIYSVKNPAEDTPSEDNPITPSTPSSSSGGGFSGKYNYPVNIGDVDGADVTASENYATAGETVTITIDPDMGKKVDEVIVTDADGDIIPVTKVGDNKYTFVMPAGKVNVSVTTENADYDLRIVMQINNKNIVANNRTITNDVSPVIVGDRTLVPVRIVTELLGGTADWDEATRTVTLTIDGKVLKLVIGEEIPGYGTGATIINDRTYVPIRYISEMLGAQVEWIANTQQIVIEK